MAQKLYLLVSAVLMAVVSQSALAEFVVQGDGLRYSLSCLKLAAGNETLSYAPWALMALAVLIILCSLFTLFLVFYQNYALQKRMTIFTMLVILGFILTYGGFFFYYQSQLEAVASQITWWAVAVPVVVLILQFMAFLAIRKKEATVLFEASSVRLRD